MIRYIEEKRLFVIETKKTSYVFGISDRGIPLHAYYGERLLYPEEIMLNGRSDLWKLKREAIADCYEYRMEYATFGRCNYDEESLKLRFNDGVSDIDLIYKSHIINDNVLELTLFDSAYSVEVVVVYRADEKLDMIERHAVIKNHGEADGGKRCQRKYLPSKR